MGMDGAFTCLGSCMRPRRPLKNVQDEVGAFGRVMGTCGACACVQDVNVLGSEEGQRNLGSKP